MLTARIGSASSIIESLFFISCTFLLESPSLYRPLSSVLVITTLTPCCFRFFSNFSATARLISFSKAPFTPTLPGSLPPCPASITIVIGFLPPFFTFPSKALAYCTDSRANTSIANTSSTANIFVVFLL